MVGLFLTVLFMVLQYVAAGDQSTIPGTLGLAACVMGGAGYGPITRLSYQVAMTPPPTDLIKLGITRGYGVSVFLGLASSLLGHGGLNNTISHYNDYPAEQSATTWCARLNSFIKVQDKFSYCKGGALRNLLFVMSSTEFGEHGHRQRVWSHNLYDGKEEPGRRLRGIIFAAIGDFDRVITSVNWYGDRQFVEHLLSPEYILLNIKLTFANKVDLGKAVGGRSNCIFSKPRSRNGLDFDTEWFIERLKVTPYGQSVKLRGQ